MSMRLTVNLSLILFKNPRDKLRIVILAEQMYPGQTNFFIKQYEEAVKRPFGYLLVNLKTTTPLLPTMQEVQDSMDDFSLTLISVTMKKQSGTFSCKTDT